MSNEDPSSLAQIREREQKATKGPWHAKSEPPKYPDCAYVDVLNPDGAIADEIAFLSGQGCVHDAEFIAHARTDIPALLDLVAAQQLQIEELRKKLENAEQKR